MPKINFPANPNYLDEYTDPSGEVWIRGTKSWIGGGVEVISDFMEVATYDPNNIGLDVYSTDNHVDGITNAVYTLSERNFLATQSGVNSGDQTIVLSGDVSDSGTGNITATLANTGVTAGAYLNADVTVDSKGRVLSISNGVIPSDPTVTLTGDVTGSGVGSFATTLANTGVTAGTYTTVNLTVDSKGRILTIEDGSGVTGSSTIMQDATPIANDYESGQKWVRTTDFIEFVLYDDTFSKTWVRLPNADSKVTISSVSPENPNHQDIWWCATDGTSYIYFVDVDSGQWVSLSGISNSKTTISPTAPLNPNHEDVWWCSTDTSTYIYFVDVDSGQWVPFGQAGSGSSGNSSPPLFIAYVSETGADAEIRNFVTEILFGSAFDLSYVEASCDSPPVGSNAIIDINVDGVRLFGGEKLNILDGELTSKQYKAFLNNSIQNDSVFSFDVDQVGSTTAGQNYKVFVYGSYVSTFIIRYAIDYFVDVDDTSLPSHTMDKGVGWVDQNGTNKIVSNKVVVDVEGDSSSGPANIGTVDVSETNMRVVANCTFTSANNRIGVVIRYTDNSNMWVSHTTGTLFYIYERLAGSWYVRSQIACADQINLQHKIEFYVKGDNFTAILNDSETLNFTSSANNSSTLCGFRMKLGGSATPTLDNFEVLSV